MVTPPCLCRPIITRRQTGVEKNFQKLSECQKISQDTAGLRVPFGLSPK